MASSSGKKIGVAAAITTTPGAMPTLSQATDALLMYENTNPLKIDGQRQQIQPIRPSLTKRKDSMGRVINIFTGVTYLQGPEDITNVTAPIPWRFGRLMRACGMLEAVDGTANTITYTPRSSAFESVGLDIYLDGFRHQMPDAQGTFTMEAAAGEYCKVTFEMRGLYIDPTVVAIPSQTFELDKAPSFKSAACTIATETVVLKSFRFTFGVQIAERRDANAANAMKGLFIASRAPTLNMVVEVDTALRNYFNDIYKDNAVHAVAFQVGTASGNRVKFSFPTAQPIDNPYGENEQLRTFDLTYNVQHQTDDAELSILMD